MYFRGISAMLLSAVTGLCFSEEFKVAKVGEYSFSYYLETNDTAVIGKYKQLEDAIKSVGGERKNLFKVSPAIFPSPKGTLVIPSKLDGHEVSAIGFMAFNNCSEIEKVDIPENINLICSGAFSYCSNLANITLPISLREIKTRAFFNCVSLKKLLLPKKFESLEKHAVDGCDNLSFIRIPSSIVVPYQPFRNRPSASPFAGLTSLRSVYMDDGICMVPPRVFEGCVNLEKVRIPEKVKSICWNAFWGCSSLTRIDIPEGLTLIGSGAFEGCSRLNNIKIPSTVTNLYASAFVGTPFLSDVGNPGEIVKDGWIIGWRGIKELNVVFDGKPNKIANKAYHSTHVPLNITLPEDLPTNQWMNAISLLCDNTNVIKAVIKTPFTNLRGYHPQHRMFWGCTSVEEVELPGTITTFSYQSSNDKYNLRRIKMPRDAVYPKTRMGSLIGALTNHDKKWQEYSALVDEESFFAAQCYLAFYFEHDMQCHYSYWAAPDARPTDWSKASERFERRYEWVISRLRQYVSEHPDCYTKDMYLKSECFDDLLRSVWSVLYGAMRNYKPYPFIINEDDHEEKWWNSLPDREKQRFRNEARAKLYEICGIFADAYDLPKACDYIMEYCLDEKDVLRRVDYYKRMARRAARYQKLFRKGSEEHTLLHNTMLEDLQKMSDLGYRQQADILQAELEREINTKPKLKDNKRISSTGTGWFVTRKHIATCWHVVEGANRITIELPDGHQVPAKVVGKDRANDVAVLEIDESMGNSASLPILTHGVKLADKIFTVGYPIPSLLGQGQKYSEGTVSALSGLNDDNRLFQISAPIQPGNSGGALVDEKGRVVGIISSFLDAVKTAQKTGTIPQNVNYAIKIRYLAALLDDKGIEYDTQRHSGDSTAIVENVMKATCLIEAK